MRSLDKFLSVKYSLRVYPPLLTKYIMGCNVIQMTGNEQEQSRVLFWGMDGLFSRLILDGLIKEEIPPIGIVVPGFDREGSPKTITQILPKASNAALPLLNPYMYKSIYQTAWQHEVPLFHVHDLIAQETVQTLSKLHPTVAVAACFPRRIPKKNFEFAA
jgi:methionyl-tRNA formyltransferase